MGFDVLTISKSLGHSDLKTTQSYLKTLDTDFVDYENEKLFKTLGDKIDKYIEETKNIAITTKDEINKNRKI